MHKRSIITGCGSFLPENIVTNSDLAKLVNTTDEWITARTGISQRHIAVEGQNTSDLAFEAAKKALSSAGIKPSQVDTIILATTTPDRTFPATATKVQAMLGMTSGAAFDVQAVCSGFIYGLSIGDNFIKAGQSETVLVIGAETFSRIIDWKDRGTCVLFGDGAGSVVLQSSKIKKPNPEKNNKNNNFTRGIISTHIFSDGSTNELLYVDGGPSSTKTVGHVKMLGKEVFKHAVKNLSSVVYEALRVNNLKTEDLNWLVPHQANKRILDSTAKKLGISEKKVIVTVDKHANTSAASIPLALDEGLKDGRIKQGDLILLEAMGGGLTWGAALIRW